jgi:hypothetical protein
MTTHLLAEKTGWISIVEVLKITKSYIVFRYAMETNTHKLFLAEQGKQWELFSDTKDASRWILNDVQNNPEVN